MNDGVPDSWPWKGVPESASWRLKCPSMHTARAASHVPLVGGGNLGRRPAAPDERDSSSKSHPQIPHPARARYTCCSPRASHLLLAYGCPLSHRPSAPDEEIEQQEPSTQRGQSGGKVVVVIIRIPEPERPDDLRTGQGAREVR